MSLWSDAERDAIAEALDAAVPGSVTLGAVDYVEGLLTALDHDPPHIWAAPAPGPPYWLELGPWERQAWAARVDGWRAAYQRVGGGDATEADLRLVHVHACEATYGDPAYGGNRGSGGWQRIDFPEPLHPAAREAGA